jgi:2-desacetyl-2-hydroxyethyl bacteriochlorophyllide A dehydrogenase
MPSKLQARALWITKPHHSELKPAEVRPCGPNDITVKAIASGISHGTEMVLYRGQGPAGQKLTPITSEGSWTLPAKFGYQNVGRVLEAGANTVYKPGDLVFCRYPHQDYFTVDAVDPEFVSKLPEVDPVDAVLANLSDVSLSVLLDVPVRVGDVVVVFGAGVVGMFCLQFAKRIADKVIVVDPIAERREKALYFGASAAVAPEDAVATTSALSDGRLADVVYEASGYPPALQGAMACAGQEATIGVVGWYGDKEVPLKLAPEFHVRRLRIVSSTVMLAGSGLQPRWDLARKLAVAVDWLPKLQASELITHRIPFDQAPEAYRLIDEHPEQVLSVALIY